MRGPSQQIYENGFFTEKSKRSLLPKRWLGDLLKITPYQNGDWE
jgi:hypothetical protein